MCTCLCHSTERFEYETTNPTELNARDASLWSAGTIWGMLTVFSDLDHLRTELEQKVRDVAFLEMTLSKFRGLTPSGWSRNGNN